MFITYIAQWLYTVMQLPVPIVLSPTQIYNITIWELFIGVLLLGILLLLIERAFNGLRYSDFRIKEKVPQTKDSDIDSNKSKVSVDLSKHSISMGKRIVFNKKERNDE